MNVLKLVNIHFTAAMVSNNYCLENLYQDYNGHICGKIAKWAKKMDVQKKAAMFKPSDVIYMPFFLDNSKTVCDSNSIYEIVEMLLFANFIVEPTKAALPHRVTADKKNHQQDRKLTTYCQALTYLLEMYATGNVIAVAKAEIKSFKQLAGIATVRYSETLWEKALNCCME